MMTLNQEMRCFTLFGIPERTDPSVRGYDDYSYSSVLPPHLRTQDYDMQLVSGAVLLPDETPEIQYNPYGRDAEEYAEDRWNRFADIRSRIEKGELEVRTLLGEGALGNVLGAKPELSSLGISGSKGSRPL